MDMIDYIDDKTIIAFDRGECDLNTFVKLRINENDPLDT